MGLGEDEAWSGDQGKMGLGESELLR